MTLLSPNLTLILCYTVILAIFVENWTKFPKAGGSDCQSDAPLRVSLELALFFSYRKKVGIWSFEIF